MNNFYKIIEELQKLNPGVDIRTGNSMLDPLSQDRIFSSVSINQLKLPSGFVYDGRNGINNKGNSASGLYFDISVENLNKADPTILSPQKKPEESKQLPNPALYPQYDFSFNGLKNTFDNFSIKKENDRVVAVERKTGKINADPLIIERAKFAISWFNANSFKGNGDGYTVEYQYSFNDEAEKAYKSIMTLVSQQLLTTGNVDTLAIIDSMKSSNYKWATTIAERLFSEKRFANATANWARNATPNSLPQTEEILTTEEARNRALLNNNSGSQK